MLAIPPPNLPQLNFEEMIKNSSESSPSKSLPRNLSLTLMLRIFDGFDEKKKEEFRRPVEATGAVGIGRGMGITVLCALSFIIILDIPTCRKELKMARRNLKTRFRKKQNVESQDLLQKSRDNRNKQSKQKGKSRKNRKTKFVARPGFRRSVFRRR